MKTRNNERGSAMMVVLLLVVIFTILGMSILTMNISAAKQFNMKEEKVQARHQAEMGLMHYKVEIQEKLKTYSFTKKGVETDAEALTRSRVELCNYISAIPLLSVTNASDAFKYETKNIGCENLSGNKLAIKITSTGSSMSTSEIITGTATFTPPTIGGIPGKPVRPPSYEPGTDLPDDGTEDYVEVSGPVTNKKETQYYAGSLVIKTDLKGKDAFIVDGGKGYNLTVAKNFYIEGGFNSHNHSCIVVKGDLTILGESYLGNKTIIVVYGNAYFAKEPDLKNGNAKIYVAGNTFVGTPPKITTDYKEIPSYKKNPNSDDCSRPADLPAPYEPNQSDYKWKLENELNPIYDPK